MQRRAIAIALPAALATTLGAWAFGGWASITLDELPDGYVVGQPTKFGFTIRQHGFTPLASLTPTIDARNEAGGGAVQAAAQPEGEPGHYVATFTLPRAGEWRVGVKSSFGRSDINLLAMPATTSLASLPKVDDATRGMRLFVAKGCVGCHVHSAVDNKPLAEVGPNLTEKRFDPAYLAMWLANPGIRPPTEPGKQMPNQRLSSREIAALSAFINGGRTVAVKQ